MTTPMYNPNIPQQPGDGLATTQPQFLSNFQTIFNVFKKNHISLTAASGAGNHILLDLLEQRVAAQTGVGEIAVYTKDDETTTDQIFIRYQGNGQEFQYTNYQIYSIDKNTFFSFLPGRIIAYFGLFIPSKDSGNTIILKPGVVINIMTAIACVQGTTPKSNIISLDLDPIGEYGTRVYFGTQLRNVFYLILGNI